jgi:hypothetical protein
MRTAQKDPARGTGRTTRALAYALIEAARGSRVTYVVHHAEMRGYAESLARELCLGAPPPGFSVIPASRLPYRRGIVERLVYDHYRGGD